MAIIYRADIRPNKLELLEAWLPTQPWYAGSAGTSLERVGAYRFDDPAGEVGVETMLVRAGAGPVLQVPLSYRGDPLPGAEAWLITTMEHSVLGTRWVYDACADPVYVSALAATILAGGTQAGEYVQVDGGGSEPRPTSVEVVGSGSPGSAVPSVDRVEDLSCTTDDAITVCTASGVELEVRRIVDPSAEIAGEHTLTGTWAGQDEPVLLATAQRR
ncbi:MAG: CG0192-related protein [Nocardioidaceae bacterium]